MEFTQVLNCLIVAIPCLLFAAFVSDFTTGLIEMWEEYDVKDIKDAINNARSANASQPINYFPEPEAEVVPVEIPVIEPAPLLTVIEPEIAKAEIKSQVLPVAQPRRRGRPRKEASTNRTVKDRRTVRR
ncbi:hypothetical protein NIES4101_53810 [Calothrix sp. NIES-4101]|nr:hypothetical protein NIES4101_53810 [Calothrix sp. NIES-4101]